MTLTYQTSTRSEYSPQARQNIDLKTLAVFKDEQQIGQIIEDVSGSFFLDVYATNEKPDAIVRSLESAKEWFELRYQNN